MNDEVKRNPTDIQRRGFLAELLCASGRLERADAQLEVILQQDPKAAVTIALLRQLIRADTGAPRFLCLLGRVPEFLDQPPPYLQNYVEATIHARENRPAEALRLIEQAEEQRPRIKGSCNGKPFEDLRNLDDVTAAVLES
jgi:type VI secretion system protein ImpE